MAVRMTGMNSGLDTKSIIEEMVAAKRVKVDNLKKDQTALKWKQDAWKELNSKLYKLYNGSMENLQYQSSFMSKTTTVSNSNAVSVVAGATAMNSVQKLKIFHLAKEGYLTGGTITDVDGKKVSSGSKVAEKLGIEAGSKFEVTVGSKKTDIIIDENTTIGSLVSKLQSAGVNANFDAVNQRMYIGATDTGTDKDFTFTAANDGGTNALDKLGILVYDDNTKAAYQKYADLATDAAGRQKVIDTQIASLLKQYTSQSVNLKKSVESINKAQIKLVEDYKAAYGDSVDLTDDAAREARGTALADRETELNEKLENETLTDDDRKAIKEELAKVGKEQAYIKKYDNNATNLEETQTKLDNLYQPDSNGNVYLNADGTAGERLNLEAESMVQEKIDKAIAVIVDYGNLTGSVGAKKIAGQNAEIELNGAKYTSSTNLIDVNGLTITCKAETGNEVTGYEEITLTTQDDTEGMYDMIKSFIKEYSELINEMDKLYNAESSRGYEPLTSEEKDAMTDTEIEEWEKKIKDSLFRRDSTLSTVSSSLREMMASGYEVNGKKMYLSDFGIETLGYFNALENEKNAYHIHGDKDYDSVANKDNDLRAMINSDPETVTGFFNQLSQTMYKKTKEFMRGTEYKSLNNVYDDKKMKTDYDNYSTKIKEAEKKLTAYEDKWYAKFAAMETALAKMQSNSSAVTGLLGGN